MLAVRSRSWPAAAADRSLQVLASQASTADLASSWKVCAAHPCIPSCGRGADRRRHLPAQIYDARIQHHARNRIVPTLLAGVAWRAVRPETYLRLRQPRDGFQTLVRHLPMRLGWQSQQPLCIRRRRSNAMQRTAEPYGGGDQIGRQFLTGRMQSLQGIVDALQGRQRVREIQWSAATACRHVANACFARIRRDQGLCSGSLACTCHIISKARLAVHKQGRLADRQAAAACRQGSQRLLDFKSRQLHAWNHKRVPR